SAAPPGRSSCTSRTGSPSGASSTTASGTRCRTAASCRSACATCSPPAAASPRRARASPRRGSSARAWARGRQPRSRSRSRTRGRKSLPAYSIPTPERGAPPAETVIGQVRPYRIHKGDTLIDLARYYDLGYNEIVDANPGIDPWVPPAGATILLPTQWVLPCCTYEGIVVNIPEMRLFFYRRAAGDPHTTIVYTYPVGPGRADWRTPSETFKIRGKTVNPQWNIPESIRKEHIAERNDPR